MRFEWDENKRRANFANHGIDFADVSSVFESETWTIIDDRYDYGQVRYFTLGLLAGRVVAVIHIEEKNVIRIISARKANNMKRKNTLEKFGTDFDRLDKLTDDEIDYSDIPPTSDEMWAKGVLRKNFKPIPRKRQLTLRIDSDVIEFFREQGRGYQTKINQLLRAYMEAHRSNLPSK